jgi:F0F1-type ATP synthase membrane subunit b/b'
MEVLGRQFRVVPEGLDPEEVMSFLETIAGSSEAAFKQLEQFAAFQTVARTMESSIEAARTLAEHAKEQAQAEAERQRQKANEEVAQRVNLILGKVRKRCISSVDAAFSILLEAVTRAQEIENEAFEKAKKTLSETVFETQRDVREMTKASIEELTAELQQPAVVEEADEPAEVAPEVVEQPAEEPAVDLPVQPEGVGSLSAILARAPQPAKGGEQPADDGHGDGHSDEGADRLYSGDVVLAVPVGAGESWMSELRQRVLGAPGVRIRQESGDSQAMVMNLSVVKPTRLLPLLESMPRVKRVTQSQNGDSEKSRLRRRHRMRDYAPQTVLTVEFDDEGTAEPES